MRHELVRNCHGVNTPWELSIPNLEEHDPQRPFSNTHIPKSRVMIVLIWLLIAIHATEL